MNNGYSEILESELSGYGWQLEIIYRCKNFVRLNAIFEDFPKIQFNF